MWRLRSCPRCGGDLHTERYVGSIDIACLQCGHVLAEQEESKLQGQGRREPQPQPAHQWRERRGYRRCPRHQDAGQKATGGIT